MSEEVLVASLPGCDVCHANGRAYESAEYDGKTIYSSWAYMCPGCFCEVGVGLGTGCGQRLVLANLTL